MKKRERKPAFHFKKYYLEEPFKESCYALYHWSPIADELKTLDRKIVLNSMRLKWNLIDDEFKNNCFSKISHLIFSASHLLITPAFGLLVKTCQLIFTLSPESFKIKFSALVPLPEAKIIIFFIFDI